MRIKKECYNMTTNRNTFKWQGNSRNNPSSQTANSEKKKFKTVLDGLTFSDSVADYRVHSGLLGRMGFNARD